MSKEHDNVIIEQFSMQAIPFSKLPVHLDSVQVLIEMSEVKNTDSVLDVACGPGLVACEFANIAKNVTGIDITKKMIEQAREHQHEKKLTNMLWEIGNIDPLPYSDNEFSVVLTRYSFHHFLEPEKVLSEMYRVCKSKGHIMVADVMLPEEKVVAYNKMERLRDPSHTRALTQQQFESFFQKFNLTNYQQAAYIVEVELEQQLEASFPKVGDEEKIRALIEQDIGVNTMGIDACKRNGKVYFSYPISIYTAQKT